MSRRDRMAFLTAAGLVALAGCAHGEGAGVASAPATSTVDAHDAEHVAPAEAGRADSVRLATIRAEVDAFLKQQGELLWRAWTRGAPVDLAQGAAQRAALFTQDTVAFVRAERDRATGDERRALSMLHGFLVGEYLARAAGAPPAPAALTWDGRSIAVSRVPALLAGEPALLRRAALEHAWVDAERRQEPIANARWRTIATAARGLGHDSLLALATELRGGSAEALASLATDVLAATDDAYRRAMDGVAQKELGKPLAEVRGRDIPRLVRAGEDRHAFPGARAMPDARATFAALGLDVAGRPGVVLDGDAREGKDPRALALPVSVPNDIRISYAVGDGPAELRGLLHELGAAAFYVNVTTPVMEFRRLGSVTAETWAELFAELIGDPAWLSERTGAVGQRLAPVVRAAAARRLHGARILAARILDEIARVREPDGGARTRRARLERAMLRPVDADELELFRLERDPLLESVETLQGMLLAARAEAFLAGRTSGPWWQSMENGAWLAATFAEGSRLTPSELAKRLGAEKLDGAALASSASARMNAAGLKVVSSAAASQ